MLVLEHLLDSNLRICCLIRFLLTVRSDASDTFKYSDTARESLYSPSWETSELLSPSSYSSVVDSQYDIPPTAHNAQDFGSSNSPDEISLAGEDDFKAKLLEYSRSVIKSAMDHTPDDTQALEEKMTITNEQVIARYRRSRQTITTLETALLIVNEVARQAEETIAALKVDQARLNADLKLEMTITDDVKRMYKAQLAKENKDFQSWQKERVRRKVLEAELNAPKHDRKRKRENVAEIWEKVEKVKVHG